MIDLRCQCGEEYHADDAHVGRRIRCLKCERVLSIGQKAPPCRSTEDERRAVTESAPPEGRYREVRIDPSRRLRRRVIVAGVALGALVLAVIMSELLNQPQQVAPRQGIQGRRRAPELPPRLDPLPPSTLRPPPQFESLAPLPAADLTPPRIQPIPIQPKPTLSAPSRAVGLVPPGRGEASPAEAKEQEIVDQDAGKPGDPELSKEYQEINERYFGNKLPGIPVLWEPRLAEVGPLIAEDYEEDGLCVFGSNNFILLNSRIGRNAAETRKVLCHEMVHEYLFINGDTKTHHGAAFQTELRRLLTEGAFQAILASEDQKASLRSWLELEQRRLDRESAALDRDQDGIDRERGNLDRDSRELNQRISRANEQGFGWPSGDEIEALKAREAVHNWRVADFNANVERHNADLRSFNLKASGYNLMMAYPDGLDEESTVRVRPLEPGALP